MKWWGYFSILLAIMLFFYVIDHRQDIKGIIGILKTRGVVRKQKYYIRNFVFNDGDEAVRFDYLVINNSGVFAVSVHNLKGKLINFQGRIYLKAFVGKKIFKYLNPVPHDVKKVIKLNAYVPEKVDIIPVVVFPRGNDNKLRAMWLTPVNELAKVFAEPCEDPLLDSEVESLYNSLLAINIKDKKAQNREKSFLKRHCPKCGNFIYDAQEGNTFYLKCSCCSFRRDFTASIIPERKEE